jgi:hypothetical protein
MIAEQKHEDIFAIRYVINHSNDCKDMAFPPFLDKLAGVVDVFYFPVETAPRHKFPPAFTTQVSRQMCYWQPSTLNGKVLK